MGGHFGHKKMVYRLYEHYWWPAMQADAKDYVKECVICQERSEPHKPIGPMQPIPAVPPGDTVFIDLIGLLQHRVVNALIDDDSGDLTQLALSRFPALRQCLDGGMISKCIVIADQARDVIRCLELDLGQIDNFGTHVPHKR